MTSEGSVCSVDAPLTSQNKIHKDATISANISAKSLQDRHFLRFLVEILIK